MSSATLNAPPANGTHAAPPVDPFEIEVPVSGGGNYVLCPTGNFPATIVGLFGVGHHPQKNDAGETVMQPKFVYVMELTKKQPDGKRFLVAERYTHSLHEKSAFYKIVKDLTGRALKPGDKFSPAALMGVPVMVTITHKDSATKTDADGKPRKYHNVGSLGAHPEGFEPVPPLKKPVVWSINTGAPFPDDPELPFLYGKSIRTFAAQSAEGRSRDDLKSKSAAEARSPGNDDDIPF